MKRLIIYGFFAISAFINTSYASQNDLSMALVGTREAVLAVLQASFKTDIPNGSISPIPGAIGYQTSWDSVMRTRQTSVRANIRPMALLGSTQTSAFIVNFEFQVARFDGMYHIRSLKSEIEKQVLLTGQSVVVINDADMASYKTLQEQANTCIKNIKEDSDLQEISEKVMLSGGEPSIIMMANDDLPTLDEKKLIIKWAGKREVCNKMYREDASYFPGNPQAFAATNTIDSFNRLVLNLYKGTVSYGEFALKRAELNSANMQKSVDQAKEQLNAQARRAEVEQQLQIQRQAANAENNRATMEILRTLQPQAPAPIIQPSINCTSRNIGGVINTNCR